MNPTRSSQGEDIVRLQGLAKSWPSPSGPVPAVRGVDLSVASGQVVALLGPNGAGKSSTIDLLLGLARRATTRCPGSSIEPA